MDRLSVIKKLNKPLIERRRRERINHHIEELNRLIVQPLLRHRRSIRKLEKADILEITVEYLKMCARNRLPVAMPPSPGSSEGSPPSSQNGNHLDLLSQQIQQLDGLATLHHLLIEGGGGDSSAGPDLAHHIPQSMVNHANAATFMPFAAALGAVAAGAVPPGGFNLPAAAQLADHLNNSAASLLNSSRHSQSTTPPAGYLSQSTNSEGDEDDEIDAETVSNEDGQSPLKQRSPSSSSSSTSGRKSVGDAAVPNSNTNISTPTSVGISGDLLMIAPTPSASSSNSLTITAGIGGSMWRPW